MKGFDPAEYIVRLLESLYAHLIQGDFPDRIIHRSVQQRGGLTDKVPHLLIFQHLWGKLLLSVQPCHQQNECRFDGRGVDFYRIIFFLLFLSQGQGSVLIYKPCPLMQPRIISGA